ncbi:MAG: hypothetical protein E3J72_16910 [Planctomycetota bacterium]|nr:MAG: hypothetical protein E3J72_16910 [Planctomycetota bacterium]
MSATSIEDRGTEYMENPHEDFSYKDINELTKNSRQEEAQHYTCALLQQKEPFSNITHSVHFTLMGKYALGILPALASRIASLHFSFDEALSAISVGISNVYEIIKRLREEAVSKEEFLASFESEPIEDGYTHVSEEILRNSLSNHKLGAILWLYDIIRNVNNPATLASVIRCIGRLDAEEINSFGLTLAGKALLHKEVEVRDAAVQALEAWDSPESIELLRSHSESKSWLKDYIDSILEERK